MTCNSLPATKAYVTNNTLISVTKALTPNPTKPRIPDMKTHVLQVKVLVTRAAIGPEMWSLKYVGGFFQKKEKLLRQLG